MCRVYLQEADDGSIGLARTCWNVSHYFFARRKKMEREGGIIGDFAKNELARSTMVKKMNLRKTVHCQTWVKTSPSFWCTQYWQRSMTQSTTMQLFLARITGWYKKKKNGTSVDFILAKIRYTLHKTKQKIHNTMHSCVTASLLTSLSLCLNNSNFSFFMMLKVDSTGPEKSICVINTVF